MRLSKRTTEFALSLYPPASIGNAKQNGKVIPGMRLPCYLHSEFTERDVYLTSPPEQCTVILNDEVALHLNEAGEVVRTEGAEWFIYRAKRWLQPWRTLREICEDAEAELKKPWTWDTLLKAGAITLLAGPPKLGKSTLVFDMLASLASSRGECIGLSLSKANVLYVSEEGEVPLAYKGNTERLKAITGASYIAFLTSHEAGGDWPGLLQLIDRAVAELHDTKGFLPAEFPLLVIIDTLGFFMDVDDENAAGQVRSALKLLVDRVREHNFACLLIHHTRKGNRPHDDAWLDSVRGSTAFAGNVDIIAAINGEYKHGDNRRWLYRIGRLYPTPAHPLALRYTEEEGYIALSESDWLMEQEDRLAAITAAYLQDPKASVRKVAEETDIPKSSVQRLRRYALARIAGEPEPKLWTE